MKTMESKAPALLTPVMEAKRQRNLRLLDEYVRLMDQAPGRSRTQLRAYLMERHGIPTVAGYYYAMQNVVNDPDTPASLVKGWRRHQQARTGTA